MILLEMMGKTAESPGSNAAGQELRTLLKTVTHNGPLGLIPVVSVDGSGPAAGHGCAWVRMH